MFNRIYAVPGSLRSAAQPAVGTGASAATTGRSLGDNKKYSSATRQFTPQSGMNGNPGHDDKRYSETDLFAGANKAGAPAASRALVSD